MRVRGLVAALAGMVSTAGGTAAQEGFAALDHGFPVQHALEHPRVAYIDQGSGPQTLLLVHGLASHAGFWRENIAALAEHYRVVAVDLPGYGRSQKDDAYPYTLSFYAATLRDLITALDLERVTVVGHSMGGQVAMILALEHPGVVERLVLAAPAGIEAFSAQEGTLLRNAYTVEGIRNAPEAVVRNNVRLNFHAWDERFEWLVAERLALARLPEFDRFAYAVVRSVAAMLDQPTSERLSDIRHPTLLVYGAHDGLIPNPFLHPGTPADVFGPAAERMGATLVEIPAAGHILMLERPGSFNTALLDWLRGTPAG